jgi:probable F420-dependent oxidoreductase
MAQVKVGVQFWPQHTTVARLRDAWKAADALGVDSIWVWDHFFPLFGPEDGNHFEAWTLLSAMAVDTSHAMIGIEVTGNTYRNPDLLADMARTVDHLSEGRAYLGLGAGWFERDYDEYGYDFGTGPSRLAALEQSLERIRARLPKLHPGPLGRLPVMIGGGGEKVTLRIVATHADAWNTFGPLDQWAHKNEVLDEWCGKVGRDPAAIERTVGMNSADEVDQMPAYVEAGCQHVILGCGDPFDLSSVERALAHRDA